MAQEENDGSQVAKPVVVEKKGLKRLGSRRASNTASQQSNGNDIHMGFTKDREKTGESQPLSEVELNVVVDDYGSKSNSKESDENIKDVLVNHESDRTNDSNGFFSSIIHVAHNAAHMITSTMDEKEGSISREPQAKVQHERDHSFTTKLESLLKPPKSAKISFDTSSEISDPAESSEKGVQSSSSIMANELKFEPVRESPLNTLGSGNLTLNHFDPKRPSLSRNGSSKSERRHRPSVSPFNASLENVNEKRTNSIASVTRMRQTHSNNLTVSGGAENLRVRRKSVTENISGERSKSLGSDGKRSLDGAEGSGLDSESSDYEDEDTYDRSIDFANIRPASRKRNKEFHLIFRKVPSAEKLIDVFSCALSKDILVQGRMYLSESHLCFNSNILGWVTNLVIPLQEVLQIEKRSTAVLFPNGMIIRTLHQRYVFATFMSRDTAFDLITAVWHGVLTENGDEPTKLIPGDTKKRLRGNSKSTVSRVISPSEFSNSPSLNESSLHDDEDNISSSFSLESESSSTKKTSDGGDSSSTPKEDVLQPDGLIEGALANDDVVDESKTLTTSFKGLPSIGPHGHAPSNVNYNKQPNDVFIVEEVIPVPLGCLFLILFGNDSSRYVNILKKQKNFDITDDKIKGLSLKNSERHYSYTKPLSAPVGPKQTRCNIDDTLVHYDLEDHILVEQVTASPDVPSGNSFKVRTRIFLSWAENNSTRIYVLTCIEWSGKSWIKSAIEKGSIEGQKDSMRVMIECIYDYINQGTSTDSRIVPKHDRRKKKKRKSISKSAESDESVAPATPKSILGQSLDLFESVGQKVPVPFLSPSLVGALLCIVCFVTVSSTISSIFRSSSPTIHVSRDSFVSHVTIDNKQYVLIPSPNTYLHDSARYDHSQSHLWKWLENRSGHAIKPAADSPAAGPPRSPSADDILRILRDRLDAVASSSL